MYTHTNDTTHVHNIISIIGMYEYHIMQYGTCRPGDVLESVNGVNLSNVDHCDAVCAISENKGILNLVRIRSTYHIAGKKWRGI